MFWIKNNWLILLVILAVTLFILLDNDKSEVNNPVSEQAIEVVNTDETETQLKEGNNLQSPIFVDVKGEVKKPGVYQLTGNSRVDDVIHLAGGFTDLADPQSVNLAQKVMDEMVINVLKKGENPTAIVSDGTTTGANQKVRINNASIEEIQALKGIGETKASAIVQYKEEHGNFTKLEDLLNVDGIGEKTLENIKDYIQVP
ncbi:helix-hairpin-helix domain-containing protein [Aquibacillus kalidii]|uniref:helix-hairpin-helix domain-containing protein n=1 Tax=Aquibacillus kalidii TaxID=2762597 RepID=UPI001647C676|nr:helix-hairpin-helix domain-containing protein [Aquibacillus kalidii]